MSEQLEGALGGKDAFEFWISGLGIGQAVGSDCCGNGGRMVRIVFEG